MTAPATTAPAYIERDTYQGPWTAYRKDDAQLGRRTAAWLAEHIGEGNVGVVWEYFGVNDAGQRMFGRTRFLAHNGELHGYNSDGGKVIIHPADRIVRFLAAA